MDQDQLTEYERHLSMINSLMPEFTQSLAVIAGMNPDAAALKMHTDALNQSTTAAKKRAKADAENVAADHKAKLAREMDEYRLKAAINSTRTAFSSLADAVTSTTVGFEKYNSSIKTIGTAAETLGGHFGNTGLAIGGAIKAITGLAAASFKQADNILKANDAITKFAGVGKLTTDELLDIAHNAKLTSKNLDLIVKPLQSLGQGLVNLGTTANDGVKSFGKLSEMTNLVREEYQRLGVSQGELIQNQADYITLQAISGKNLKAELKDRDSLRKASLEYTDNLLALAELTGKDVDSIKKQQQEAARAVEWQISQIQLENRARRAEAEGRKEEAERIRNEAKGRQEALGDLSALGNKTVTEGVRQMIATGTIAGEQASALARMGLLEDAQKMGAAIREGKDAHEASAEFMDQYNKKFGVAIEQVGYAAQLSKDTADKWGMSSEALEQYNRQRDMAMKDEMKATKDRIEAGKKSGRDPAKDARAKLTTLEIEASQAMDKLLQAVNPLISGFGAVQVAAWATAAALGAVAAVAGKAAAGTIVDKILDALGHIPGKGKGPSRPGRAGGGRPGGGPRFDPRVGRYRDPATGRLVSSAAAKAAGAAETAAGTGFLGRMAGTAGRAGAFAGKAMPVLGTVAALGYGAYDAYQGVTRAEEERKEGRITNKEATVKKHEAVGSGVGSAAGGVAGGLLGAKGGAAAGASIGAMFGGVGAIPGALIGSLLGGLVGSIGGAWAGGKVGSGAGTVTGNVHSLGVKNKEEISKEEAKKAEEAAKEKQKSQEQRENLIRMFGTPDQRAKLEEKDQRKSIDTTFSERKFHDADPASFKEYNDFKKQTYEKLLKEAMAKRPDSMNADPAMLNKLKEWSQQEAKVAAAKKFGTAIEAANAGKIKTVSELTEKSLLKFAKDRNDQKIDPLDTGGMRRTTVEERKTIEFNEQALAEKDEKLYNEFINRKKELYNKELKLREARLGPNASGREKLGAQNFARFHADQQAKEEFAERAEKIGAAKIIKHEVSTSQQKIGPQSGVGAATDTTIAGPVVAGNRLADEGQGDGKQDAATLFTRRITEITSAFSLMNTTMFKLNELLKERLEIEEKDKDKKKSFFDKLKEAMTGGGGNAAPATSGGPMGVRAPGAAGGGTGGGVAGGGTGGGAAGGGTRGRAGSTSSGTAKPAVATAKGKGSESGGGILDTIKSAFSGLFGRGKEESGASASAQTTSPTGDGKPGSATPDNPISAIKDTGPGYNVVERPDGTVERQEGARNWRNNNPGNIEYGDFASGKGAIGTDGRFAIFPSYTAGRGAKESLIFDGKNYTNLDLSSAIARYAPPSENNTEQYQKTVLAAVNNENKLMKEYSAGERTSIMDAMEKMEGFKPGKVTTLQSPTIKAKTGGMFTGPDSGYPAELHGRELVAPLDANSILEKLAKTPVQAAEPVGAPPSGVATAAPEQSMTDMVAVQTEMMDMLSKKLDDMIYKLSESNGIQDKILRYAKS